MDTRRLIIALVLVIMLVVTGCSHGTMLPLTVTGPSDWQITWTGLSTDPDEKGQRNHRDVTDTNVDGYALYYAADSQYLYLRMETVTAPGWESKQPKHEARYKWWFDTAGTAAWVDGTTVKGAEFLLILEDLTDNSNDPNLSKDQLGELTLMDDLNEGKFMARWDSDHPPNYTKNNAQTDPKGNSSWWRRELGSGTAGVGGPQGVIGADIGYRIDNLTTGGNFVDMYVSWAALGNPSSVCLVWATDNIDPNLDQAQDLDRPEVTNCLSVCIPPIADFHASDINPCVNQPINFTGNSTGSPTTWSWDVDGDGVEDYNTQNPSHTYTSDGTYTVSLTVTNGCGPDTETKTDYITVDALPDANFHASDTNPCVNEEIDFFDDSTGTYDSWSWDVDGDGTEDYNTPNPSHTYTSDGTYTVSLTVSNGCGPDTETKTDYITVGGSPTADFSGSPISGCAPLTVVFTDLSTGDPTSWSWTFTGGSPASATGKGPHTVTYNNPGTYTVSLTVSNACGSGTKTKINYITVHAKPTADAGADKGIIEGASVVIGGSPTASGGTAPYTYSWIPTTGLNDAGIANPTASPSVTTTYTVTVTDSKGCTDNDDVTVTVTYGCCIYGFVYRAGTMETLAGWEVILEKKTSPWLEVQRTTTDANGKYYFCGLGDGEYRVSEVVKSGWTQVSPVPNQHLVTLPEGCCDPGVGPFLNFLNTYMYTSNPSNPHTVGWEASPIDKPAVLAPWIALFTVIAAGASLLVLKRRRAQS